MKERPILFSGPMVKAILDGRKTMTRRVAKNQPGPTTVGYTELLPGHFKPVRSLREFIGDIGSEDHKKALDEFWADDKNETLICPYGRPGDKLWVREAWAIVETPLIGAIHRADWVRDDSEEREGWWMGDHFLEGEIKWKPSLFMPRWASRLTLEITAVRVERVQDITEEDAKAEGCPDTHRLTPERDDYFGLYPTDEFAKLWDSLNAKRGYGRDANPWVWVISFKRVK